MNTIYFALVLVVGAAMAQAECLVGVEKPTCLDITHKGTGPAQVGEVVDCRRCHAYAIALRVTSPSVYLPSCVQDSSLFVKAQYDPAKDESFCVDEQTGHEYDGSRVTGQTIDCSPFPVEQVAATPCLDYLSSQAPDYLAECQVDGHFGPTQCAGTGANKYCWCSAASGQLVPETVHSAQAAINCQAFRDFTFDCSGLEGTNQPYPGDCARYIKCSVAGTFSCACDHGRLWDTTTGTCNVATDVNCNLPQNEPAQPEQPEQQPEQPEQQ